MGSAFFVGKQNNNYKPLNFTTMATKRFILQEEEIPRQWYNIQADMPNKPLPMLHPATKQPVTVDDLAHIFSREASEQELNQTDRWIDIPEEVRDLYKSYRSTPLVRAYGLEEAIGTKCHIYFKNESVSPVGSHKLNMYHSLLSVVPVAAALLQLQYVGECGGVGGYPELVGRPASRRHPGYRYVEAVQVVGKAELGGCYFHCLEVEARAGIDV